MATLTLAALCFWLVGLFGIKFAEEANGSRLAGGVLLAMLLSVGFYFSSPTDKPIREYEFQRERDRKTLESTGVTPIAIEEFDAETQRETQRLQSEIERLQKQSRAQFNLAVLYPTVAVTLLLTLFWTPRQPGFMYRLPMMLYGAGTVIAPAVFIAMGLLHFGVVKTDIEPRVWVSAMAICCAVTAAPGLPELKDPLWRWLFEPLLYALAGSSVLFYRDINGWLVLAVLVLFSDVKALGAMLLAFSQKHAFAKTAKAWHTILREAIPIAAGSPTALALALAFHAAGWIDGQLLSALVIANAVSSLLAGPMLRLIKPRPVVAVGE